MTIRSIRYALEIYGIGQVVALDRDKGVFGLFKLVLVYVVSILLIKAMLNGVMNFYAACSPTQGNLRR